MKKVTPYKKEILEKITDSDLYDLTWENAYELRYNIHDEKIKLPI